MTVAQELTLVISLHRWLRAERHSGPDVTLPPGPGMQRLDSLREVVEEWVSQDVSHELFDYTREWRPYAVFRLTHPERASLRLDRDDEGEWFVRVLEAPGGRPVDLETRAFVEDWLGTLGAMATGA